MLEFHRAPLSPLPSTFNHIVSDYPLITSQADDFTVAASAVSVPEAPAVLSSHIFDVAQWARHEVLT